MLDICAKHWPVYMLVFAQMYQRPSASAAAAAAATECAFFADTNSAVCRNLELEESERLARENMKDIIACGFNPDRTFIFTDFGYLGGDFSRNIKRIER